MQKWWVIPDPHFKHQKLIDKGYRPSNFMELIIENWRDMITNNDTVIVLGDVTWRPQELLGLLRSLPGRKLLVKGNHDTNSYLWYMKHGFAAAMEHMVLSMHGANLLFTHKPVSHNYDLNIHGHLHGFESKLPILTHYSVSLEKSQYKPILLDKIVSTWRKNILTSPPKNNSSML